jgi:hypothetical protein
VTVSTPYQGKPTKLPDPIGAIARVKARLPKRCAVRCSKYVDNIISLRLQGKSFQDISDWLREKGQQHFIPKATLFRNLKAAKLKPQLTLAEEIIEQWGGEYTPDEVRELRTLFLLQKTRVEHATRAEKERQKTNPSYYDRRLRQEVETLRMLLKTLHDFQVLSSETVAELLRRNAAEPSALVLTDDAAAVLTQLILSGELQLDFNNSPPDTKH